jgi:hypothetical protein
MGVGSSTPAGPTIRVISYSWVNGAWGAYHFGEYPETDTINDVAIGSGATTDVVLTVDEELTAFVRGADNASTFIPLGDNLDTTLLNLTSNITVGSYPTLYLRFGPPGATGATGAHDPHGATGAIMEVIGTCRVVSPVMLAGQAGTQSGTFVELSAVGGRLSDTVSDPNTGQYALTYFFDTPQADTDYYVMFVPSGNGYTTAGLHGVSQGHEPIRHYMDGGSKSVSRFFFHATFPGLVAHNFTGTLDVVIYRIPAI